MGKPGLIQLLLLIGGQVATQVLLLTEHRPTAGYCALQRGTRKHESGVSVRFGPQVRRVENFHLPPYEQTEWSQCSFGV